MKKKNSYSKLLQHHAAPFNRSLIYVCMYVLYLPFVQILSYTVFNLVAGKGRGESDLADQYLDPLHSDTEPTP